MLIEGTKSDQVNSITGPIINSAVTGPEDSDSIVAVAERED